MKPLVIKILIGAAWFAGGFAAGFFAHKKMNEVKFEEVTKEEFAEIEKQVAESQKKNDIPKDTQGTDGKTSEELGAAQNLPEKQDELRNHLQGKTPYIQADSAQKTAYEKMWKATKEYSNEENANNIPTVPIEVSPDESEHPQEEEFDESFLEQIEQEAVEAGNNFTEPPHQIDLATFYNEFPEYDSVTIKWYEPDNVWLDENDEIIPDISSYIGFSVKNPFAMNPYDDEDDVRFWINDRYGTKYELIRHHRSYRETVGE